MDAEKWEWGIRKCHVKFLVSTSPGLSHSRESGCQRQKKHPSRFARGLVETSYQGEFETGPVRANPGKYCVETQTGRRFEASACWYNRRVKLSSISLIQLRGPDLNRRPRGYELSSRSSRSETPTICADRSR